ncbi:arginine--tRNA ligase [Oscillospiraceae bacterium HV4-5-C5C]|nr:arginine--tRNA ligase [Oscillospiraceae bacterium HV4-5-C5C]
MTDFRAKIAAYIAPAADWDARELAQLMEIPPQAELGDYALPCFALARHWHKAPQQIAVNLQEKLSELPPFIRAIKTQGPYLNIFLDPAYYMATAVKEALDTQQVPGQNSVSDQRPVIVEFSSPNIAKPFHIGHAFTTILGEALARIYTHQGYRVLRFNHLGDYGTQFGKLIVAYERWCNQAELESDPIKELNRLYVAFHQAAKEDPELEAEARLRFKRLEEGLEPETALWKQFRDLSLREFNRLYQRLNIQFDNMNGESFYSPFIPAVVEMLQRKHLLEESEGAQIVRLDEYKLPPCMILKSDGTTIYASRDIAAILYRKEQYDFQKNLYVVGLPQSLHFQQVFAVLKKAGYDCADDCEHIGFGTVRFAGARFSTREGHIIELEDLLNEAVAKSRKIIEENNQQRGGDMSVAEMDLAAERIGLGAVQYTYLRSGRERDIVFSWDEMLNFEGDTAPYLLYTYARARSILRKAGFTSLEPDLQAGLSSLGSDSELQLGRLLNTFAAAVQQACQANEPFMVARHIAQLARTFNKYYGSTPVLNTPDLNNRQDRLELVKACCRVLETGLNLLGIQTVDRM